MSVDCDSLIQRQASEIMIRDALRQYAQDYSPAELQAGADALYKALMEIPIEAPGCFCSVLPADKVCPPCWDEAAGIEN